MKLKNIYKKIIYKIKAWFYGFHNALAERLPCNLKLVSIETGSAFCSNQKFSRCIFPYLDKCVCFLKTEKEIIMPATKQVPEGTKVPEGWACEMHDRGEDALVWFSPSVVSIYEDYDSRHTLTNAVGDEINTIPSDYIPYGTVTFKDMLFVYNAIWFEEENYWVIEVDLGGEPVLVGYV